MRRGDAPKQAVVDRQRIAGDHGEAARRRLLELRQQGDAAPIALHGEKVRRPGEQQRAGEAARAGADLDRRAGVEWFPRRARSCP